MQWFCGKMWIMEDFFKLYETEQKSAQWNYLPLRDDWWHDLPDGFYGEVGAAGSKNLYANTFSSRELAESVATVMLRHIDALEELAKR
jgi:hypothetical protein